ncbi:MAG: histidine kinase [Paracoccaceae bacterium]|nr:histidine kinase [Paracoccaceae bacterium]
MQPIRTKPGRFRQTLPGQFLLAGGGVMLVAMLVVGTWVADRIEQGVVENSAIAAALYMESFISPLSQELADAEGLSQPAGQALQEIFANTALGERVVTYKIWKPGGLVVEASDPALVGRRFEPSQDLAAAWTGEIAASFEDLNDLEDEGEAELGIPLLEVYSPIRELWTGEIIAVAEFYERADGLARVLADAQRKSWLVVSGVFLTSGLLLYGIVRAGGRTIERQQADLEAQLVETRRVSEQNRALRERVMAAATRSTAQAERVMQRVGLDLHDGVAQHLSLASLRLDEALGGSRGAEAGTVRTALDAAMRELRAISRGLALPDLEHLDAAEVVRRAVDDHRRAFGTEVRLEDESGGAAPRLPYAARLCLYRFLQEGLSNAHRHAGGAGVAVTFRAGPGGVEATVSDRGGGFDPAEAMALRADGGQGLFGLRDRAEALGGQVRVHSEPGAGSRISLTLPVQEEAA